MLTEIGRPGDHRWSRRVFLAPDGALNLVPFAALVDENGEYLSENYSLDYLTSGRDLLRLGVFDGSRETPKIFADPMYDLAVVGQAKSPANQPSGQPAKSEVKIKRARDFITQVYEPLPGTAAEGIALTKLFRTRSC